MEQEQVTFSILYAVISLFCTKNSTEYRYHATVAKPKHLHGSFYNF